MTRAITAGWRLTPASGLAVLRAEVRKGLAAQLAHPIGHVVTLVVSTTLFIGVQFVVGQGELRHDLLPPMLVAVGCYWFLHYGGLVMVADLIEDKRTGTFGQALMSPAPPWLPMLGRLVTATVFGLAVAAVSVLVPMLVAGVTVPLRWAALLPFVLVLVNVLAFTFVLAAIAIASPSIGALQSLFTTLILLLNGSFLPLAYYPHALAVAARFLPTTLGVEATTKTLFGGRSLAGIWADGTLPWLIVYTLALCVFGGVLFVRNHRRAIREGRLDQY